MTILNIQMSEHKWWNDFQRTRVYAMNCNCYVEMPKTSCKRCQALLHLDSFRHAISKPLPKEENYIFINHLYCDLHLGELYVKTIGL